MLEPAQYQRLVRTIPILQRADPSMAQDIQRSAFFAKIPAGRDVFIEGDRVDAIALLVSGVVRVYKVGETGREITLYRFGLGQSCILTANAILSQENFPAIATVEQEAEAVMIPSDTFRRWVDRYSLWRDFVFDLLSHRLVSVMEIVDEVAFQRLDKRLSSFLLERSQLGHPIRITHQEIASELGSSREVISRMLENLADQGLLESSRGQIEIIDRKGLNSLAVL
jgi:CRP/FNR family transcriptional regulator